MAYRGRPDHFNWLKGLQRIGIFNNNLARQVFSQKGEFIQHFIGGSEMRFRKWRWLGIFSPNGPVDHSPLTETTDNDLPIDLIFRLQIVTFLSQERACRGDLPLRSSS